MEVHIEESSLFAYLTTIFSFREIFCVFLIRQVLFVQKTCELCNICIKILDNFNIFF